tara:strand:- start:8416 stop:9246 length:831 start_codon:yes stop_codon:yes gene_type:complete
MKINLFILGMQRCGTTSLFNYLKNHQKISYTKIKETNLFSDSNFTNKNHNTHSSFKINLKNYKGYLNIKKNSAYLLEASVNHFYSKLAPEKIYKYNPRSKFIIIYREPISRLKSHYYMDLLNGHNKLDINKSIKKEIVEDKIAGSDLGYLEMSKFAKFFKNWLKFFDRSNFLVLSYDELFNTNNGTERVEKFLCLKMINSIPFQNSTLKLKNYKLLNIYAILKKLIPKFFITPKIKYLIFRYFRTEKFDPISEINKKKLNELFYRDYNHFMKIKNK